MFFLQQLRKGGATSMFFKSKHLNSINAGHHKNTAGSATYGRRAQSSPALTAAAAAFAPEPVNSALLRSRTISVLSIMKSARNAVCA